MAHDLFLEESDYFCFCHVDQDADGAWYGWVNFERKRDHDEGRERISGTRHAVQGLCLSERDAVAACAAYAHVAAAAGDVGL